MAKVDLESGIAKALSRAPLSLEELNELDGKGIPTLMVDHDLDRIMAEIVVNHVMVEKKRHIYQDQMTRKKLEESIRASLKEIIKESSSSGSDFSLEDPTDFSTI